MKVKSRNTLLILVSALMITACQTSMQNPVSHNQTTQNIDMPVVEAILDSDGDGVPDELDQCPNTPESVVVDDRGCPFTMPGVGLKMEYRAFFAKGSSELSKEYQLELDKVAEKLKEYDTATMLIIGTASVDEINETSAAKVQPNSLSRNRALIVKNYLLLKHKIDSNRFSTFACGTRTPIAPSDTEEQRSMNRRVYGLAEEVKDEVSYNLSKESYAKICLEVK